MNEKIKKTKHKTEPMGVRFDKKKFEFVKEREGLETSQMVVNFLLDEYYFRHMATTFVYDNTNELSSTTVPENTQIVSTVVQLSQYEAFSAELKAAKYMGDITDIIKEVRRDTLLNPLERRELEREATELSKNFYND